MPLKDYLAEDCVCFLSGTTKAEALSQLVHLLVERDAGVDRRELARAISRREKLMSTGIGLGIAVPHVRLPEVPRPILAVGLHRDGIPDYESLDGKPVHIVVMIAAGKGQHVAYIQLLAEITRILKNEGIRERILRAPSTAEIHKLLVF